MKFFLLFISILIVVPISAQNPLIRELDSVVVRDIRLDLFHQEDEFFVGDSNFISPATTLAQTLSQHGDFFVKNYGPSGLSTVSSRGADASHTILVWNGISLQNPMNGVTDFSLIDPFLFSSIKLTARGSSSLFGTSAIGGIIQMKNAISENKGLSGSTFFSGGSFGHKGNHSKVQWRGKKIGSDISISYMDAQNDFPIFGSGEKRANTASKLFNLNQNNFFNISSNESLSTHLWYQKAEREIPAASFASHFEDLQKDEALRLAVNYKKVHTAGVSNLRTAFLQEYNYFDNSLIAPSDNIVRSFIAELEHQHRVSEKDQINVGFNYTLNRAISSNYENDALRNQLALFSQYKRTWNQQLHTLASVRGSHITDLNLTNIAAEVKQIWTVTETQTLNLSGSRNFKAPTFNDLYWPVSGNPNLLPEEGYNFDLSHDIQYPLGLWKVIQKASIYSNHIENWIQWVPAPPAGLFRPVNHKYVWSRGLAFDWNMERSWEKLKISSGLQYNLTKSTVERTTDANPEKIGKQLIYVPLHAGKIQANVTYADWSLFYFHNLTASRFTDPLNKQTVDGFQTGDLSITWKKDVGKAGIGLFLSAEMRNVWNQPYEVVAFYPMPPRAFYLQAGVSF